MNKWRSLLVLVVVIAVVGAVAGYGVYNDRVAPYRTVVVRVDDDREVNMGYFVKRLMASGGETLPMLSTLSREEIILKVAPHPPYNIVLSDDDVEAFSRSVAQAGGEPITDAEYREWLRQQLNDTGFTETEFRGLMRRNLTMQRLNDFLGEQIETVAEQVLLQAIVVVDSVTAQSVVERLDAGEPFEDLAREFNRGELQTSGGEWGWFSRAGLPPALVNLTFDQLTVGERSSPVVLPQPEGNQVFAIVRVADRAAARSLSDMALVSAKARALNRWYAKEQPLHRVSFHGLNNAYDSETDAWVKWQIQRQKRQ